MPSRTKAGLNLADKNSYVRVEENINDNLLKIDDDVDAIWGGLYGGYIQDETIVKEVGKRYIDKFNKKAYICEKASNVNTKDAYTECNVVSNLDKLNVLSNKKYKLISSITALDSDLNYAIDDISKYKCLLLVMKNNDNASVATMFIPVCIITSYPYSFTATGYYAIGNIDEVAHKVTFNSPTSISRKTYYDVLEIWAI